AVMSFNPHSIHAFVSHTQTIPVGLVTDPFAAADWPIIAEQRRKELAEIPDLDRLGCSFISHNQADLGSNVVQRVKDSGRSILCWTIRSKQAEAKALKVADNVTFEGYIA
ncbi:MAG: phosphodiesterase, partial [Pseudomonadota bacterium]